MINLKPIKYILAHIAFKKFHAQHTKPLEIESHWRRETSWHDMRSIDYTNFVQDIFGFGSAERMTYSINLKEAEALLNILSRYSTSDKGIRAEQPDDFVYAMI